MHIRLAECSQTVCLQADPSYGSLSDLAVTMRSRGSRVRVIIAPQARTCSQKIANLGAAIKVI